MKLSSYFEYMSNERTTKQHMTNVSVDVDSLEVYLGEQGKDPALVGKAVIHFCVDDVLFLESSEVDHSSGLVEAEYDIISHTIRTKSSPRSGEYLENRTDAVKAVHCQTNGAIGSKVLCYFHIDQNHLIDK